MAVQQPAASYFEYNRKDRHEQKSYNKQQLELLESHFSMMVSGIFYFYKAPNHRNTRI
jgi:hypothetical protein